MMGGFLSNCRAQRRRMEESRSVVGVVLGGRWADVMDMWGRIYAGNTGASIMADAAGQRIACQYR